MNNTTTEEFKKLDEKNLLEKLNFLNKEFFQAKFEVKTGQSKNIHFIKNLKKQIAQVNTILRERDINKVNKLTKSNNES